LIILKANPISPAKIKSDRIRRRNDGRWLGTISLLVSIQIEEV
jgi:hypothetical protein